MRRMRQTHTLSHNIDLLFVELICTMDRGPSICLHKRQSLRSYRLSSEHQQQLLIDCVWNKTSIGRLFFHQLTDAKRDLGCKSRCRCWPWIFTMEKRTIVFDFRSGWSDEERRLLERKPYRFTWERNRIFSVRMRFTSPPAYSITARTHSFVCSDVSGSRSHRTDWIAIPTDVK